jgi:hypothetical protein
MPLLPKFAVVVWIKKTDPLPALRDELIELAADEPDESTEFEGMVEFRWGFDSFGEAESIAVALTVLGAHPDLMLLRLSSYDAEEPSITFKDARNVRQ